VLQHMGDRSLLSPQPFVEPLLSPSLSGGYCRQNFGYEQYMMM
jgi:hypothetical protein